MSRILTASLLVLSACAHAPATPTVTPEVLTFDVEYGPQSFAGASLTFPWELNNLTATPARVEAIDWTMELQGEPALTGQEKPDLTAAPNDKAAGRLTVTAVTGTGAEAFAARAAEPGLRFTFTATFTVAYGATTDSFEAEWRGEIFPPKEPSFSVRAQASRSGAGAELNFVLVITNPNPFPVRATGFDYAISVDGVALDKGTVGAGQDLGPGSDTEFDVTKPIDKKNAPELHGKLGAKTVPYAVEATLRAGELVFARKLDGEIVFPK